MILSFSFPSSKEAQGGQKKLEEGNLVNQLPQDGKEQILLIGARHIWCMLTTLGNISRTNIL